MKRGKILIKGAGDLASGIALRLHHSGFQVLMTETAVPTTVRRTVAFSPAVYLGQAAVEDVLGRHCRTLEEAESALREGVIPVMMDVSAQIQNQWHPDVVVDAIIAKVNTGTTIRDAAAVIGVGPGFHAGLDCHCVIETKRGHYLGRCIWTGEAIANTGIPGLVGGYGIERLLRAGTDGVFRGTVEIGARVKQGDVVAYVDDVPVCSAIDGIVRGILQDGVVVTKGMKAGDVDPRCAPDHCYTVSDKARSVGGGVLEAILCLQSGPGRPGFQAESECRNR